MLWFNTGQQQRSTWSLYSPSPHWGGEENGKKKVKLVGQDENSLTEQQRKRTLTTVLKRRIHRTSEYTEQLSSPDAQCAPKKRLSSESQNHRMVGVGRDLCGSSSTTPLPKQGHLHQAAQDLVQAGLEYLQRRRLHNSPGQPVPVLCHPHSKEVLPHVQDRKSVV